MTSEKLECLLGARDFEIASVATYKKLRRQFDKAGSECVSGQLLRCRDSAARFCMCGGAGYFKRPGVSYDRDNFCELFGRALLNGMAHNLCLFCRATLHGRNQGKR